MRTMILAGLLALSLNVVKAQVDLKVILNDTLKGPYTGRLFVYTLKDTAQEFNERVMAEQPAFYKTVQQWRSGEEINFRDNAIGSHIPVDSLQAGYYKLVAILDTNRQERRNTAPGNLYSRQEGLLRISASGRGEGAVTLNAVFRERSFQERPSVKEVTLRSRLLSDYRHQPIFFKAAVILPANYALDTTKLYPVVLIIPGWGGTHHHGAMPIHQKLYGMGQGKDKIYVYLNPETQTPWGLHAFVDSRVNGPWGRALVDELLPYLENTYRITRDAKQRFLTGQSSGGYGAVWLALNYPNKFGACWATSPDPLDFSSFTGINLYEDANYYTDRHGRTRGINRVKGVFQQSLRAVQQAELFDGDGGQQRSFEAEFGLADNNGRPKPLFNGRTGKIDRTVVKEWQRYDLGRLVQQHWPALQKSDLGPIRIYVGAEDNYLLNDSAAAFAEKASKAGAANIQVITIPGADHFQVRGEALTKEIQVEMDSLIKD